MKRTWLKLKNGFLAYSRGDRIGIIILAIIVVILIGVKVLYNQFEPRSLYTREQLAEILEEWDKSLQNEQKIATQEHQLFEFDPNKIAGSKLDSLALPENVKRNLIKYRDAGGHFNSRHDFRKLYGINDSIFNQISPYLVISDVQDHSGRRKANVTQTELPTGKFDPNFAKKEVLKSYGLNNFQVSNIVAYRNKGGTFKQNTDLLKIYGMDSLAYNKIERYIKFENTEKADSAVAKENIPVVKEYLKVELNKADTTQLKKLNGIGSVYAARIIKYRELLGGFYSKQQLLEVYGFSEETYRNVEGQIVIDTLLIKKIRINFAEYRDLIRHPYFNKSQTTAILNAKDKDGPIKEIADLKHIQTLEPEFIDKIRPYITCR